MHSSPASHHRWDGFSSRQGSSLYVLVAPHGAPTAKMALPRRWAPRGHQQPRVVSPSPFICTHDQFTQTPSVIDASSSGLLEHLTNVSEWRANIWKLSTGLGETRFPVLHALGTYSPQGNTAPTLSANRFLPSTNSY